MKTQSLYTSFVGKLLVLIVLTLFAWGNAWATVTLYSSADLAIYVIDGKIDDDVVIDGNVSLTESLAINGTLTINSGKSLSIGNHVEVVTKGNVINNGTLTITDDNTIEGQYAHLTASECFQNNGVINLEGGSFVVGTMEKNAEGNETLKTGTGDFILTEGANLNYNSGISMVVSFNDFIQNENSFISFVDGRGYLVVEGEFNDKIKKDDNTSHPWKFEYNGEGNDRTVSLVRNENFTFYFASYERNSSDLNVSTINSQIKSLEDELNDLKDLKDFLDKNPTYKGKEFDALINQLRKDLWRHPITYGLYLLYLDLYVKDKVKDYDSMVNDITIKEGRLEELKALKDLADRLDIEIEMSNIDDIEKEIDRISSLLPISLTSFTASQTEDEIEIAWTTNSEVNNDFFTVEYSVDGVSFKTVEIVAGSGTTSEVNEYAITTQASQFNGVVYFRLKQTDYNGEYSYSDVVTLAVESSNELYVYPNPATEFVSVSGLYKSAIVQDMFGKKVAVATNGEQIFVGNLSAGTYYVVFATENGKKVLPFVKE